ncbi:sulfatase-like hydrolase/transferase [Schlesneria paludicola]|uniref:sulfatase-like hydrolase/transferase n=1 Tax=Schlesneria paludicola TaxID=360056 RepID=UPI00029B5299|nr:sulfatase-like hydrolase/transferase [Schlesneria paludicola]
MMSTRTAANIERSNLISVRTMHLFTLCSFAVSGPLLTAFSRQTVYIHDQQFSTLEIGVMLLALVLVIPVIVVLLDQLAARWSRRTNGYGRDVVVTVLFNIFVLSLLRPYVAAEWLVFAGLGGILALSIAVPTAVALTLLYVRTGWMKAWLTFASVGILVFPVMFVWQFQAIVRAERSLEGALAIQNPVPVVMVILDEFTSVTLMDKQMEIDAARFPQFARLAGMSTWYRNMTTNHPRTDVAVPTLLSGVFPTTVRSPLAAEYPGNLLQIIDSTKSYETAVFEPVARLSPEPVKHVRAVQAGVAGRCVELLHTLATVYPRLIFTSDTPIPFPTIPRTWFGVRDVSTQRYIERQQMTEGVFNYPGSEDRRIQLEHFLRCLKGSDRPRFCFLHTVFPHHPWCFMPSGDQYLAETSQWRFPTGATGELGEDWHDDPPIVYRNQQRYRAQAGYLDQFIGKILDRLQEANILDRCLLVVTGDHGVSFRPGHSRRLPDAETLPEILSVPLFIKFPGQSAGEISDRNVESVDVLPTIAEVLGVELPAPVDGSSVLSEPARLRKTLYLDRNTTIIEPNVPQRAAAVKRQAELFGDRQLEQPARESISHPEWLNRPLSDFVIDARPVPFLPLNPLKAGSSWERFEPSQTVACLVMGELKPADLPEAQADLVIAVDGTIVDTGTSYRTDHTNLAFEFLLPESVIKTASNGIELYLVDKSGDQLRLRPLARTVHAVNDY